MTIDEFIDENIKNKIEYGVVKNKKLSSIRTKDGLCPIIALYNYKFKTKLNQSNNLNAYYYGAKLGLIARDIISIVKIMDDNNGIGSDNELLRKKLLICK